MIDSFGTDFLDFVGNVVSLGVDVERLFGHVGWDFVFFQWASLSFGGFIRVVLGCALELCCVGIVCIKVVSLVDSEFLFFWLYVLLYTHLRLYLWRIGIVRIGLGDLGIVGLNDVLFWGDKLVLSRFGLDFKVEFSWSNGWLDITIQIQLRTSGFWWLIRVIVGRLLVSESEIESRLDFSLWLFDYYLLRFFLEGVLDWLLVLEVEFWLILLLFLFLLNNGRLLDLDFFFDWLIFFNNIRHIRIIFLISLSSEIKPLGHEHWLILLLGLFNRFTYLQTETRALIPS